MRGYMVRLTGTIAIGLWFLAGAAGCAERPYVLGPAPDKPESAAEPSVRPPAEAEPPAQGVSKPSSTRPDRPASVWDPLIDRLVADGVPRPTAEAALIEEGIRFDPDPMRVKLEELSELYVDPVLTEALQRNLTRLGYRPGPVDGLAGAQTRRAIKAFEMDHNLPVSGRPTDKILAMTETDLALPPDQRPARRSRSFFGPPVYEWVLTPDNLARIRRFFEEHRTVLAWMEDRSGVPAEVAVGIMSVETNLGQNLGQRKALAALASMAASADFDLVAPYVDLTGPPGLGRAWLEEKAREKGEWAYNELKAFFLYAEQNDLELAALPGSIYGAVGLVQFMPSTALRYAHDADGDGRADMFDLDDALSSLGRYLKALGWPSEVDDAEAARQALYGYNRSTRYVNTILAVAEKLGWPPDHGPNP
jgi:membrane-bound lytic murein transglycosylase B